MHPDNGSLREQAQYGQVAHGQVYGSAITVADLTIGCAATEVHGARSCQRFLREWALFYKHTHQKRRLTGSEYLGREDKRREPFTNPSTGCAPTTGLQDIVRQNHQGVVLNNACTSR